MKQFFILAGIILASEAAFCKTLEIKLLNTPTISIEGKNLKVGNKFDEKANISWMSNKQAMKVLSEDNKLYVLTPKLFSKYNITNFSDYITYIKSAYVRNGGDESPVTLDEHKNIFEQDFILLDSLKVNVGWKVDDKSYFLAIMKEDDPKNGFRLPYENGQLIFTRDFFNISAGEECELTLTIKYIEEVYKDTTLVTDNMYLYVPPLFLPSAD